MDLRDGTPIGPYTIRQRLAAGGMAEIYLASAEGPGGFTRRLVIKRVAKSLLGDARIRGMFLDEAKLQSRIEHPNIVQVLDFGEEQGAYYMAQEFVDGATLRWVVDNANAVGRPVPVTHALRIAADVLEGLAHAHAMTDGRGQSLGLVHRDISPVNVLVSRTGVAKLCDFGVAKSELQSVFTQVGIVKGKYRYMAPEQVIGATIDQRVDVYAVGLCLWEMLTGRRLFTQRTDEEVARAIQRGGYPPPSRYRRGLPRAIDDLVMRALSVRADDRFSSARGFALACESLLRQLPDTSNRVYLSEYLSSELDGIAGLAPDRRQNMPDESLLGTGLMMLDPPVPRGPTQIRPPRYEVELPSVTDRPRTAPSVWTRALSVALAAPGWLVAAPYLLWQRARRT